jgi:hypothetical protein
MNAWLKEIDRATTEAEIVESARDYCSLVHPRELATLPEECREINIADGDDIPRLRQRLSEGVAAVRDRDADTEKLRDLVNYLSRASERLGELCRPH